MRRPIKKLTSIGRLYIFEPQYLKANEKSLKTKQT